MVAVGVGVDSIGVDSAALVLSSRSIEGSLTWKAIDGEDTLGIQRARETPSSDRNHAS